MYEFHIAAHIRRIYNFTETLFTSAGNVIFANFTGVRQFVFEVNKNRADQDKLNPGLVNGAGLMDEIFHLIISHYEQNINPDSTKKAIQYLTNTIGREKLYDLIFDFTSVFQPREVYKHAVSVQDYLNEMTGTKSNFEISLEELILLHLDNYNPVNKNLKVLIDENYLSNIEIYKQVINEIDKFFDSQPTFGPENKPLVKMLKTPIDLYPEDIEAQLSYIQEKWGVFLGEDLLRKLLKSQDFLKENRIITFGMGGPPPTVVPRYKRGGDFFGATIGRSAFDYGKDSLSDYEEFENFTPDIEWMPRVVLMAKNIHVWLDQLSKKYERNISRLDQIPDEEIDRLVNWGINGLWLIGLWERSSASKKIKHIMGNIDAVASAYSLYDYEISHDLGGEEAYNNFNHRAKEKGLRLASDMVPNHTGIFSRWVIEHPEYFIQSDYPPFPNYTFTGTNLSDDQRVQLRIEDGYWERRDAAVVFQRIDNRTGEIKYFYHGNDGTNMPWNDTAQLNMLNKEVREAVIQKIFDVARKFSIIRFDAAMTLTKKHFSRLWYPQPGTGGDIPSRSDFALTRSEFDEAFPVEFWREVVDRINNDMPETLLLAEAFWLMEGYFVRTLGMHRVYNSAFMHMLMREENEKYRDLISNTLEFEPEILKRYVNFMSNPDEETAIKQFGTDDKYFGVLLLMVTLPGLPMFAHGQIEGFTEKYGMEYKRAYYNETAKSWLVERHEREIFPLLKKRYVFSGIENFWLFDFKDSSGNINENVFAYVNGFGNEKALVLYNNKYDRATGSIKYSSLKLVSKQGSDKDSIAISLAEALGVENREDVFYRYYEHISGREFLVTGSELYNNGFVYELNGFEYRLFWNFRKIDESVHVLGKVKTWIGNYGSDKLYELITRAKFEPLYGQLKTLFDQSLKALHISDNEFTLNTSDDFETLALTYNGLLEEIKNLSGVMPTPCKVDFADQIRATAEILELIYQNKNRSSLQILFKGYWKEYHRYLIAISVLINLKSVFGNLFNTIFKKLYLGLPLRDLLYASGKGELYVQRKEVLLYTLLEHCDTFAFCEQNLEREKELDLGNLVKKIFNRLITENGIQDYLSVNEYNGIRYFSREGFEELILELIMLMMIRKHLEDVHDRRKESVTLHGEIAEKNFMQGMLDADQIYQQLILISEICKYDFDKLIQMEIYFKKNDRTQK